MGQTLHINSVKFHTDVMENCQSEAFTAGGGNGQFLFGVFCITLGLLLYHHNWTEYQETAVWKCRQT